MADISSEINKIIEAVLGEEVRGSIKNALLKMNDELGKDITKVTPTEVDDASECIVEGISYKVIIDGSPSIIIASLNDDSSGIQYRLASSDDSSNGVIYYRPFTLNPFSAEAWTNISAQIDATVLEPIVNAYLETHGYVNVESTTNKINYNVDAPTDPYNTTVSGPSITIGSTDNVKYQSLKALKQFVGTSVFSMPEMFKKDADPDDTNSIQRAINYAVRRNVPFRCAKNKEYIISEPIHIRVLSDMSLVFDFCNAKLKAVKANNSGPMPCIIRFLRLTGQHDYEIRQARVRLQNVILDANNEQAHTGLFIDRSVSDIFENISVFDARRGIYARAGVEAKIQNCYIRRTVPYSNTSINIDARYRDRTYSDDNWWLGTNSIYSYQYFSQKISTDADKVRGENFDIQLEDGTTIIDPNYTENVGIDSDMTDMWIQNCVVINHIVGIAARNGDTKISGCHPWVDNEQIVRNAVAYYNKGTNYYSDCTCDRFKIGFYCGNNAPMYLTNTHISSKPTSETVEAFAAYCFYIPSTVYHKGSEIHAVNTRIHGIKDSWTEDTNEITKDIVIIPKNWTNIPGGYISDVNTSGYGSLNYMNSNLKPGEEYKKLIYTNYSIALDTSQIKTNLIEQTVPDNPLIPPDTSQNPSEKFGMKSTIVSWRIFQSAGDYLRYRLAGSTGINTQVLFYITDLSDITIQNPIFLTVSYQTNVLGASLMLGDKNLVTLQTDNEEHSIGIVIDAKHYSSLQVYMDINVSSSNTNFSNQGGSNTYFYLWNIMAFDWTGIKNNIARYYLEDFGHYLNRISKYINNTLSENNPAIKSAINIPAIANQKILCKSEKCTIDINSVQSGSSISSKYPNYYKTRYNVYGGPIITVDDTNKDTEKEFASITMSAPYMSIGVFEPDNGNKMLIFNQNESDIRPINTDSVITYSSINGPVKMIIDIPVTEKINTTTNQIERTANTCHIASLRFGTDYLEPDTRLTSNGEIIKCYPDGKIYAVMLDSEGEDDLPTFAYTLEDI